MNDNGKVLNRHGYILDDVFLLLAAGTRSTQTSFGIGGGFAIASSGLHLTKAQTDTEL